MNYTKAYSWPLYYSGDCESDEFLDVLPEKLTLQMPACAWRQSRRGDKTIFKEVVVKSRPLDDDGKRLMSAPIKSFNLDGLFSRIKSVIFDTWDISKAHVISHSSGYDSRVISAAIKSLREEFGEEWFGDTVFVECLGEGNEMGEIMRRQGFDRYIAYGYDMDPGSYHYYSFDFGSYHEKYNGIVGFPVNVWYDAYKHLRLVEAIPSPDNVQFYGGYGSNAIGKVSMRKYFSMQANQQMQFLRTWADDVVFPFWDYNVMEAMLGIKEGRPTEVLSKHVSPELNDIPRLTVAQFSARGYRMMDDWIFNMSQDDYDNSWYGKRVPIKLKRNFYTYNECWGHYGAASLCEYLLQKGYKISL